jgi:hypothetical protein
MLSFVMSDELAKATACTARAAKAPSFGCIFINKSI